MKIDFFVCQKEKQNFHSKIYIKEVKMKEKIFEYKNYLFLIILIIGLIVFNIYISNITSKIVKIISFIYISSY